MVDKTGWRSGDPRWGAIFLGGAALLLAGRLLALHANATDLFFDEAQYWSWSLEPALGYYSKPPMVAWLIRAATDSCGVSEFCVRLPSPLVHTATAGVLFLLGRWLYDVRTGALSGLAFATLPGVSLSSGIISTDVPLLFAWAVALLALVALIETRKSPRPGGQVAWWPGLLLGLAFGFGLNAKYAMAWFVLCLAVYLAATPARRWLLRDPRLWLGLALGVALIAPNLAWNAGHKFATFAHTADNARWHGSLLNPLKALEFFGSQFGVFGPVLFAGLLVVARRAYLRGLADADRLLLAFALPVLVVITGQAFVSRAHANWAAVSYVAATVLVVATLTRDASWGWLKASFAVNVALAVALGVAAVGAGRYVPPFGSDPFARTLGWRGMADATRAEIARARAAGRPYAAILTDDRSVTAELLYYMRDDPIRVVTWFPGGGRPTDHYELTRPHTAAAGEPLLFVTLARHTDAVTTAFAAVSPLGVREIPTGKTGHRRVAFFSLAGYHRK